MTTWNLNGSKRHVLICNGSSCMRKGGEEVTQAIRDEINRLNIDAEIHTTRTRCNGRCKDACVVIVYPDGNWFKEITPELGRKMVQNHMQKNNGLIDSVLYEYDAEGFVKVSDTSVKGIEKPVKIGG
ncbi:(2Fe-2S) ferredoxin domain-containing protein [Cytobacillus oceanisediminis]|uniref:(2Fe-2S) ferredoxin n=1 Tax=Cytobacillus oceanisediminis TaxID=665099 RepID=A0A562K5L8_9BACI|nr:(2Fe-2S) ferredoxin domain-containing protein [Cytobacillus oceanisediminis]TWH90722.1 (2Fe-2S) ferredoxin [Cytobacillus oceanisediminis]